MTAASIVVPADTLEYFRLKRELREVNLSLDETLFSAVRESFSLCRGRKPQSSRELAEYYIELSESGRDVLRKYARE
jgi:hypothetical protein